MQITFSEMELEDLWQVSEIEKSNFSQPWKLEDFRLAYDNPNAIYILAKVEEQVIGVSGLYHILGDGMITNIAVLSEYRGQGIAHGMLLQLLRVANAKKVTAFTLEVRESNLTAIRLYEKLGFVTEGIRKFFYDNPKENALIMWKR